MNSPEAIAFFENEWRHAIKQAKEALAEACSCYGLWNGLCDWLWNEPNKVAAYVGDANYELFTRLVTGMPLLAEETARAAVTQKAEMQRAEILKAEIQRIEILKAEAEMLKARK
jgi:hypothetical protein